MFVLPKWKTANWYQMSFTTSKLWKKFPKEHHVCLRYHTEVILSKDKHIIHLTKGCIWVY